VGLPVGWSLALVGLLAQAAPAPAPSAAQPTATTFSLRVSIVADSDGKPIAKEDWLVAQVASARQLFAPFGVDFARTEGAPLGAQTAHVETRADRDAFAAHTAPHAIDVFVVESLRDVDTPERMRRGVHWRAPSGAHYIVIVSSAPPTVLAHELGHYFGNPHSQLVDNVMCYERSGAPVFFDADQGKRIAAWARAYVRSGELVPVVR